MIVLSLGSNLDSSYGNRFKNIDLAISYLKSFNIKLLKKSSFYETPSYPNNKNPKFINIIIEIEGNLTPLELAKNLILVEERLERKRGKKNDPRTCDIDIIDFENKIIDFKMNGMDYSIPHKRLSFRNFVLFPLKEILPQWKHPKTNEDVNVLIDNLSFEDKNSILKVDKY